MLVAAAFWRPDGPCGSIDAVLQDPEVARYVSEWPLPGELGVVAETDQPVGAAWLRFFTASDPGFGFVEADTPELSVGVVPQWRGRGVGRELLGALIAAARDAGIPALSLSVGSDNHARHLYAGLGFQPVTQGGGSVTMTLHL